MGINTAAVQRLYVAYFNRPADPVGLAHWEGQLGTTAATQAQLTTLAGTGFSGSAEYAALYAGQSDAQIVNSLYTNLFGRAAEPAGLVHWAGRLTAGTETFASIALQLTYSAQGTDATAIANKLTAATAFTTALDTTPEIVGYSGTAAAASGRTYLAAVTDVAATLTTATAGVNAAVIAAVAAGTVTTGTTFTLTTGLDSFTGTSGNDTFNAADPAQLQVADVLIGGAGTDTLNYTNSAAGAALPAASITGIEVINARAAGNAITSGDLSVYSGVTDFNSDRSTSAVTVTNLASGGSFGIIGNTSVTNASTSAFGYIAAATAGVLNISGGTLGTNAVTITGTGLTSQAINSTGAANVIGALTGAASVTSTTINATTGLTFAGAVTNLGATVTVTGAGAVDLFTTALEAGVTTIAASAHTGGLTAALGTLVTQTVTLGSGNDVITSGAVLTTGSVNAGAGTDTLVLGTNVSHANTASLAAKYTNFETLRVNGTFDASLISSLTAIELSGATNSITNLTATQAAAVTARADIGATTLTLANSAGTSDVLNLTLGTGLTTAAATNAGILTISGFETLNLKTNAGPTATTGANKTSTITGAIVDTSLTAINLTGTAFVFTDIATTKAVTINGSALTGDGTATPAGLTVAGSALAGSTITGSAFVDTFTIGAEGSTYTGGAGNDTFTTTAAILNPDGTTDATVAGGLGTDTLTLTGALTLTDLHFTNVTGMEKLTSAATTAVSYTGFAGSAKTAFADGLTITTGTLADNATYTLGAGLYDKAVTDTLVSSGVGNTTADNIAITTGAGADTITVTAASWVGATGGSAGQLTVSTGAGIDTISVTISVTTGTVLAITTQAAVIITGGTGADVITAVGVNAASGLTPTFVVAAGDSLVSAYDSITGFDIGDGSLFSSTLDFAGTSQVTTYAATAATGFSAAELTVAVTATSGLVVFAGTSAASATLAQKIAAVQSVVTTNGNDVAVFTNGANTYVFQNNATADTLVELVGITGTALATANATTAGLIFIA